MLLQWAEACGGVQGSFGRSAMAKQVPREGANGMQAVRSKKERSE
jgi:hypothetical protein